MLARQNKTEQKQIGKHKIIETASRKKIQKQKEKEHYEEFKRKITEYTDKLTQIYS